VREAAVRLFAARGFHGTGIRDLAIAAGLSSASLYHYMGTKEDLLVDIMVESLERLLGAGRQLVDDSASPSEALARLVQLHVVTHALLPDQTMVVDNEIRALSAERRDQVLSLRDRYESLWREVIAAGQSTGDFVIEHPAVVRLGLLELCTGVARWYSPEGPLSVAEVAQEHVRLAHAMLGVRGGRGEIASAPSPEPVLALAREVWGLSVSAPSPDAS
jgi:AcrR family transcriptional regulator